MIIKEIVKFTVGAVGFTGVVVLAMAVLLLCPWIVVWCVDSLFGYRIELTFRNWVAIIILLSLVRGGK